MLADGLQIRDELRLVMVRAEVKESTRVIKPSLPRGLRRKHVACLEARRAGKPA